MDIYNTLIFSISIWKHYSLKWNIIFLQVKHWDYIQY